MEELGRNLIEVDIHQLEMPLAESRLQDPGAVLRLGESLQAHGQKKPVLVAKCREKLYVLDGYDRVEAVRRYGGDTIWVECIHADLPTGILIALINNQSRKWEAMEEAELIRQLIVDHGMSRKQVACAMGKDPSWVNRRLNLCEEVPDCVVASLRNGDLGTWAATRVLAPMARAEKAHAIELMAALKADPMSCRELADFYRHYRKSSKKVREKMIADPHLFLKAQRFKQRNEEAELLAGGPEKQALGKLKHLARSIRELESQMKELIGSGGLEERKDIQEAFDEVDSRWHRLKNRYQRSVHDATDHANSNPRDAYPRDVHPRDQQEVESLSQNDTESTAQGQQHGETQTRRIVEGSGVDQEPVQKLQRQCDSAPGKTGSRVRSEAELQCSDETRPRGSPQGR